MQGSTMNTTGTGDFVLHQVPPGTATPERSEEQFRQGQYWLEGYAWQAPENGPTAQRLMCGTYVAVFETSGAVQASSWIKSPAA